MKRVVLALLLAGCTTSIDPTDLPSTDGYRVDWHVVQMTGEAPGHGAGCRNVYINDVGRAYGHAGRYKAGTVLVKDIWLGDECGPGEPDYTAIMRRIGWDDPVAEGLPLQDEWLFTLSEGGGEEHYDFCWTRCHLAAPWDGAWYDYGAP